MNDKIEAIKYHVSLLLLACMPWEFTAMVYIPVLIGFWN